MDRRQFMQALVAGGTTLGASGWTVHARAAGTAPSGATTPVVIVSQRGVAQAGELAEAIAATLGAAGIAAATIASAARWNFADVDALLDRPAGTWLIGVTQDAPAAICQAVAATRGSACVLHAHHRIGRLAARHCCTSPAVSEALLWTEPRGAGHDTIGRIYAEALGAPPPDREIVAERPVPAEATAASLASFLIRI